MTELTSQEINQLIEALIAWEKEPSQQELQGSLFGVMFAGVGAKTDEERRVAVDAAKAKSGRLMEKAKQEDQIRREVSVILQAKLLSMRNAAINTELSGKAT
jgi:hypothetical protein